MKQFLIRFPLLTLFFFICHFSSKAVSALPPTLDTLTIDTVICDGAVYEWPDGSTYDYMTGANLAEKWLVDAGDSTLVKLNLTVNPIPLESTLYSACDGDTIYYNDFAFTRDTILEEWTTAANGCDSLHERRFWFAKPEFAYFTPFPETLCLDQAIEYVYGRDFISNIADRDNLIIGDSLELPDGSGASYVSNVFALTFPEASTIESADEFELCINMEHSWMHDLQIELVSPDGKEIILQEQEQIPSEVFLGEPTDGDGFGGSNVIPGTGSTYCWNTETDLGTWTEFSQMDNSEWQGDYTLPAAAYTPFQSFDILVGSPWNGEWKLQIADLWPSDNGFVFYWLLRRKSDEGGSPDGSIVTGWTSSAGTITGDTLSFTPTNASAGQQSFTFSAQDTMLGCGHEVQFTPEVIPSGLVEKDTVLCPGATLEGQVIHEAGVYEFDTSYPVCESGTLRYEVTLADAPRDTVTLSSCVAADVGLAYEYYNIPGASCDSVVVVQTTLEPSIDTVYQSAVTCNPQAVGTVLDTVTEADCSELILTTYSYQPLEYELEIMPDTCISLLANARLIWPQNPSYPLIRATWYAYDEENNELFEINDGIETDALAGTINCYVEIHAGDNCIVRDSFYVPNYGSLPPNDISYEDSIVGTTAFYSVAQVDTFEQTTYDWTFHDGSTANEEEVVFDYERPGIYPVRVDFTSLCWSDTYETNQYVPPITYVDQNTFASVTDTLLIPILFNGASQLRELNVQVNPLPDTDWELLDLLPSGKQNQNGQLTLEDSQLSWTTPSSLNFENGDTIAVLKIRCDAVDTLFFDGLQIEGIFLNTNSTPSSLLPFNRGDMYFRLSNVQGQVVTAPYHNNANAPVENVDILLEGNQPASTDDSGHYLFPGIFPGQMISLEASKADTAINGLSTEGILRLLAHINGTETITDPYQLIAADANCSAGLDTSDVFQIQDILMEEADSFSNCPSWVFVPESYAFTNPSDPYDYPEQLLVSTVPGTSQADRWLGIKKGDVIGEADYANRINEDTLFLQIPTATYQTGATVSLPFRSEGFTNRTGFQLEVQFDPSVLDFDGYTLGDLPSFQGRNIGLSGADEGRVRLNWFNLNLEPTTTADGQIVFTLQFQAVTPIDDLTDYISLNYGGPLSPEAYDEIRRPIPVVLLFDSVNSSSASEADGLLLYPNEPNPFSSQTVIPFYLPRSTEVTLSVFDIEGRKLLEHHERYTAGLHRYQLDLTPSLPSGMYNCVLTTPYGRRSQKIICTE